MKKILVLLITACSLLAACSKENGEPSINLDGTKWSPIYYDKDNVVIMKDGLASFYFKGEFKETVSYTIKGNIIHFADLIPVRDNRSYKYASEMLDKDAELAPDKSSFSVHHIDGWENGVPYLSDEVVIFVRVVE